MKKEVSIKYPDGSIHRVFVKDLRVTNNNEVVIIYADEAYDDRVFFTEIVWADGVWVKSANNKPLKYYSENLREDDFNLSRQIINELGDYIGLYEDTIVKKQPEVQKDNLFKELNIKHLDGSTHNALVEDVRITNDNKVIIIYQDKDNNNKKVFTEIVYKDGGWQKNPHTLPFEKYKGNFINMDYNLKRQILDQLGDYIPVYKSQVQENVTKTSSEKSLDELEKLAQKVEQELSQSISQASKPKLDEKNNDEIKNINMIIKANTGDTGFSTSSIFNVEESSVQNIYNPGLLNEDSTSKINSLYDADFQNNTMKMAQVQRLTDLKNVSSFFEAIAPKYDTNSNEIINQYKEALVSPEDKEDIATSVIRSFGDSFDIASLPPVVSFKTNSGNTYNVSFHSCSDVKLYLAVNQATELKVSIDDVDNNAYEDPLTSALHYELPLEIKRGDLVKTNGVGDELAEFNYRAGDKWIRKGI